MIKRFSYVKIAVCFLIILLGRQNIVVFSQDLPLLPYPRQIFERKGVFNMNEFVPVFQRKNATLEEQRAVWTLCDGFESIFGTPLKVTEKEQGNIIVLRNLTTEIPSKKHGRLVLPVNDEGYQINIFPNKIEIIANSNTGLYYGTQTLLQLFRISSVNGSINCMTINDMPNSSKRYLCYDWDSINKPSYNYIKQLIQWSSHFKFNGIVFLNDTLSSPFAEMEMFYLKKYAEQYHIDIVTSKRKLSGVNILNINMKNKIYPEFQQTVNAIFPAYATDENKMTLFHNSGAALFIDNWYSMLWTAELLWNQPKYNSPELLEQRQLIFERALDKQLFEVNFPLCELLKVFDSLQIVSLTEREFWRPVSPSGISQKHNPANNRFVLNRAMALEKSLQLLLDTLSIKNDVILYSTIFAAQRAGFIALKNLLQESLSQQNTDLKTIQETTDILLENIRHLKKAHETLWGIENSTMFPESIVREYDRMIMNFE